MSNIKYTTDGKKVVVVGELNQTETIVQEIFVTENGDEIPQGERFVVKSLLDQPSESWKEKKLRELAETFVSESSKWDHKIKQLNSEKSLIFDSLSARVRWLRKVADESKHEQFESESVTIELADKLYDKY